MKGKQGLHLEGLTGFNFRKDCFYCGYAIREREKKTKKSYNVSCKNREVDKAVHQAIFDRKDNEWFTEFKGRLAFVNDFRAEDAMYHIQCSSNFRTGKGNPKKSIMPKKRGRHTTADKETVFLEIVQHIESHSSKQFDIATLEKMMEEKLSGNNVLYLI